MDIFDIARIAGVSRKTVQRVLNNAPNVHPDTRARIKKIMEQYHYEPSAIARKLSAKKTYTIGLFIVQDHEKYSLYSDDWFYGAVISAIIRRCAAKGYNVLTSIIDVNDTEPMLSLYRQKSIDGGLLISWSDMSEVVAKIREIGFYIGVFDQNNISRVNVDIPFPYLDNKMSAYDATNYLLDLGHTKLGMITGEMENQSSSERLEGFLQAVKERGIDIPDSHIFYGQYHEQAGIEAVESWLKENDLPTALFCSNDLIAYGALKTLQKYHVSVPEQISVIGFDDLLISQYTFPPLTTMQVPREEMAYYLTDELIRQIEGKQDPIPIPRFRAKLVVRSSCSAVPQ